LNRPVTASEKSGKKQGEEGGASKARPQNRTKNLYHGRAPGGILESPIQDAAVKRRNGATNERERSSGAKPTRLSMETKRGNYGKPFRLGISEKACPSDLSWGLISVKNNKRKQRARERKKKGQGKLAGIEYTLPPHAGVEENKNT